MHKFSEIQKVVKDYIMGKWEDLSWEIYYRISNVRSWYNRAMNCTIRRLRHGFNPGDIWSLDYSIAAYILPRLKYLKKKTDSHPSSMTKKQWERELNKMILAFELMTDDDLYWKTDNQRNKSEKLVEEGLASFAKYCRHLWS